MGRSGIPLIIGAVVGTVVGVMTGGAGFALMGAAAAAMTGISSGLAVAGAGMSYIAQEDAAAYYEQQGRLQEAAYNSEFEASREQADIYQWQAEMDRHEARMSALIGQTNSVMRQRESLDVKRRAIEEALLVREAGDRTMGAQVAGYAAGNVAVSGDGTPSTMLRDTARKVEKDVREILTAGDSQSLNLITQATMADLEGRLAASRANSQAYLDDRAAYNAIRKGHLAKMMVPFTRSQTQLQVGMARTKQLSTLLTTGSRIAGMFAGGSGGSAASGFAGMEAAGVYTPYGGYSAGFNPGL